MFDDRNTRDLCTTNDVSNVEMWLYVDSVVSVKDIKCLGKITDIIECLGNSFTRMEKKPWFREWLSQANTSNKVFKSTDTINGKHVVNCSLYGFLCWRWNWLTCKFFFMFFMFKSSDQVHVLYTDCTWTILAMTNDKVLMRKLWTLSINKPVIYCLI